jgi:glutathione S-transferase
VTHTTLYAASYSSVPRIGCSPPSWMIHMALAEKGVEHEVRWLDYSKGEHRAPEMLALNPRGSVPVLTDGDAVLTDSIAALEYLEWRYPEPELLPEGEAARARALDRLHESVALKRAGMHFFAWLMRASDDELEQRDAQARDLAAELELWETHYEAGWAAGDSLTLADLPVLAYVATAFHVGVDTAPFQRLQAFVERMHERPALRATWPSFR